MKEIKSELIFDSQVESPLVTIAIPTYKRNQMLIEAVLSAINQDFNQPYEVIVVDNNPERNDITEKAMASLRECKNLAYYKNLENIGMVANWNRLYDLAKGKYVVMLHDDDMLFPYYLRLVFSFLEKMGFLFEMVYPFFFFSSDRDMPERMFPNEIDYREMKVQDFVITQWGLPSGMMILKEKVKLIGGFSSSSYPLQDQDFIYRALHYVKSAELRYQLVLYYIGENESMKSETMKSIIAKEKEMNLIMRSDKDNKWKFFARICYRFQMKNISSWGLRFVEPAVIQEAFSEVGLKENRIKDWLSIRMSNYLKRYIYSKRIKRIVLVEK